MSYEDRPDLIERFARRDHEHPNKIILYMTDAERAAMSNPKDGQIVFTTDDDFIWAYSTTYGWKRFAADPVERWDGDVNDVTVTSVATNTWTQGSLPASSQWTPTVDGTLSAEAIAYISPVTTEGFLQMRIVLKNVTDTTYAYSRASGGNVTNGEYIPSNPLKSDFSLTADKTYELYLEVYQDQAAQNILVKQIHATAIEGVLGSGSVLADSSLYVLKSGSLTQITTRSHTDLSNIGSTTHANIDSWLSQAMENVKVVHSATGDGVADDTAEIQAALDAVEATGGGIVYLPYGTYLISAALDIASKVTLMGSGWGSALKLANSSDCNVITQTTGRTNDYAGVRNLQIQGNKANQASGHGIYAYGSDRFLVENCFINNCKQDGIRIDSNATYPCEQPRIINNYILSCDGIGIYTLGSTTDGHIRGNDVGWSADKNIVLATSSHIINDNTIWGATTTGIQGYWCSGLTITGNRIDYNNYHGLQLHGVTNSVVTGNNVYVNSQATSNIYDGIHVSGESGHVSEHIMITGNTIGTDAVTETQRYGIYINDTFCDFVHESGNAMRHNVSGDTSVASGANASGSIPERQILLDSAKPTSKLGGYMSADDETLYYFVANGDRYKITATLDPDTNWTPMGLLLAITKAP